MKLQSMITIVVLAMGSSAFAVPSTSQIKDVLEYYYNGEKPQMVDSMFCSDIVKDGDNKHNCESQVNSVTINTPVVFWMQWFVPKGKNLENVLVQFNQNGITRKTSTISLTGALRYRTWKNFTPNKAGEWEVKVLSEADGNVTTLFEKKFTVN